MKQPSFLIRIACLLALACGFLSSCVSNGPVGNPAYGDHVERVERSGHDVNNVPDAGDSSYVPAAQDYINGSRRYGHPYGYGGYGYGYRGRGLYGW